MHFPKCILSPRGSCVVNLGFGHMVIFVIQCGTRSDTEVYSVDLDPYLYYKGSVTVHSLTGMCIGSDSDKGSCLAACQRVVYLSAAGAYYISYP